MGNACEPASCGGSFEDPALSEQLPAATCGRERWAVKTLADPEAEKVKINSPETTTIERLCALPPPAYGAANPRSTVEGSVFTVEGFLVGYTLAADSDLHAVIRDAAGETLIIEFPNHGCL
jgi:hypothetical protein